MIDSSLPLILSPGTQVVSHVVVRSADGTPAHPSGSVGVILKSPSDYWHSYRVQFPDATEASMTRDQFSVLSQFQWDRSRNPRARCAGAIAFAQRIGKTGTACAVT